MEATILARIAELEKAREQLIIEANQNVSAINGGIAELRLLIAPKPEPVPGAPAEVIGG